MNIRAQAKQQLAQLMATEALGTALARKFTTAFNAKAVAAARTKGKIKITKAEIDSMAVEVGGLMMLAFARRYRQQKAALGIQFSFSSDVAALIGKFDLNIPNIKKQFTDLAGNRVTESARFIESKINDALASTNIKQQPTAIAIRNMRRELDEMGLSAARPSIVETLVRTHAQIAFGAAQYQLEQDDPEDLITGYQYVTVGDDRVRDDHAEMDGVIFEKDDPRLSEWWPPNGWNCRCQLVALTDPVDATKTPRGIEPDEGFDFNPGELLDEE